MRHSVRVRFMLTLICAAGSLALPAAASASGRSPVHIDPSSPVAKEYALPLATARGAPPESGQTGQLFGAGIKHAGSQTPARKRTVTGRPRSGSSGTSRTGNRGAHRHRRHGTHAAKRSTKAPKHHRKQVNTVTLQNLTKPGSTSANQVAGGVAPTASRVLKPGSGSAVLWMAVAAIIVIVLGSIGGMVLSRRR